MEFSLNEIYTEALRQYIERPPGTRLQPSGFGYHPAREMLRIQANESTQFDDATLDIMRLGNIVENDTFDTLAYNAPFGILRQFPLWNDLWQGYADAIIGHGTDHPMIVEHKFTEGKGWEQYSPIKSFHAAQLWLYGELYKERFGIEPQLRLYYRAPKGRYCEVAVSVVDEQPVSMYFAGRKDGSPVNTFIRFDPNLLRQEIEECYRNKFIPDGYEHFKDKFDYPEKRCSGKWAIPSTVL